MIDYPTNALFYCFAGKVEKQAKRRSGEPEIGQQLLCMEIREALHRFYLKYEAVFHAQIDAKRVRKPHVVEYDIDRRLPVDLQASSSQRSFENRFVDTF